MVGDVIVEQFLYVDEVRIFDDVVYSYAIAKVFLCQTLKLFTFRFSFNGFITYITIEFHLFIHEFLREKKNVMIIYFDQLFKISIFKKYVNAHNQLLMRNVVI